MATRLYKRRSRLRALLRPFNTPRSRYRLLILIGVLFLWASGTVLWWSRDLPDPQNIRESQLTESTKIFDSSGEHLLYEIGEARRTWIELEQISPNLVNATLAAEDDQFFRHNGLDFKGLLRGVILKPLTGQRAQGGSTITQQLIKISFLSPERTIRRKVKEAVLAVELEQRFSKEEILTMYLNAIPYGNRSYGVEAASQTFFGTQASELSIAQASILAALPNAPTYYSPYGSHFEDLKLRQKIILDRMADLKMISQQEAETAAQLELTFEPPSESIRAPHFVFYVKEQLDAEYGERVVDQGGLQVITTLDFDLQTLAEETLKKHTDRLKGLGATNGALVAIDPKTGNILAMAGSLDYFNDEIDGNVNVAVRHRSPGSSIKPIIYTAAFDRGYTPNTILIDAETDFGQDYRPKNYDLQQRGPVSMRTALANSMNIPAVKTLYLVGVNEAVELAQKLGMESLNDPERYGLSLVLGGGEVRLVDITSAYSVFAAEGVRHPHRAILKVDAGGETLFDITEETPEGEQVIDAQTVRITNDVLSDNGARALTFGARSSLQLGSRPVAAKTGTTQEFRDGWTVGFTPSLTVGIWTGNNDNTPMGNKAAGANTAAPIWNEFMQQALDGTPIEQFTKPEQITNIPHAVLRGELPEVKGKWIEDTKTLYTLDCPIAEGQPRTFKEIHSILYSVRRTSPLGSAPARAEADPQFAKWEEGIAQWIAKDREKNRNNQEEPIYTDSLPTPVCNISSQEELPKVTITEPNTSILTESPVTVRVEVDSQHPIREVRFLLDNQEIGKRGPDEDFSAAFSFDKNISGRKTLLVQVITENNLIGRAHRTFLINPDDSSPSVTFHTPSPNTTLKANQFPQTIKLTATDPSGIDVVDVLYRKEGQNGNQRVGQTSTQAPIAPNRYEVIWNDSPGKGSFEVFAIVYDKTGNFTETEHHEITIE